MSDCLFLAWFSVDLASLERQVAPGQKTHEMDAMVPPLSPLSFMHEQVYADQQTVLTGLGHGQNVQALLTRFKLLSIG